MMSLNSMKLIIGLGNYGDKYRNTRHNVGFIILDEYARRNNLEYKYESKFDAAIVTIHNGASRTIIAKPMTYVNLSGNSLSKIMNYYNINIDNVLIIYDDIDLVTGRIRIREQGGHGGHNGVRSIIKHGGTRKIKRIKIGIDIDRSMPMDRYVLGNFSKKERELLLPAIDYSIDAIDLFIKDVYFKDIMTKHNTQT